MKQEIINIENRLQEVESKLDNLEQLKEEEILSVKQAADFLGLVPSTIYHKTSNRLIPFYKKGKHIYFIKSELIKFLKGGSMT